jgi:hypothetical protein
MTMTNALILPAILLVPRELIATPDGVAGSTRTRPQETAVIAAP